MRVLIIKMSSLGDIIHTLPALTDAGNAMKNITFDWVVEEQFQDIPALHPLVKNVIPIALRRWSKNIFSAETHHEWTSFRKLLQANHYDLIIDAQGLLKSAFIARFAKGSIAGLSASCAREKLAALFYHRKIHVEKNQHAISRLRALFSKSLGYTLPNTIPEYKLNRDAFVDRNKKKSYLVFLHGTTWETKHWPEEYWIQLAQIANSHDYTVRLLWGNKEEHARALRIASACQQVEVLSKLSLKEIASILVNSKAVVSVDTGLGHLAAALDVPMISLYGPTSAELTGALGKSQVRLQTPFPCSPCFSRTCIYPKKQEVIIQPPCFSTLRPEIVWKNLEKILEI